MAHGRRGTDLSLRRGQGGLEAKGKAGGGSCRVETSRAAPPRRLRAGWVGRFFFSLPFWLRRKSQLFAPCPARLLAAGGLLHSLQRCSVACTEDNSRSHSGLQNHTAQYLIPFKIEIKL